MTRVEQLSEELLRGLAGAQDCLAALRNCSKQGQLHRALKRHQSSASSSILGSNAQQQHLRTQGQGGLRSSSARPAQATGQAGALKPHWGNAMTSIPTRYKQEGMRGNQAVQSSFDRKKQLTGLIDDLHVSEGRAARG